MKFLVPIAIAHTEGRQLEVMRLIREYSPLLEKDTLVGANVAERLKALRDLVASIAEGIAGNSNVTIGDLLKQVYAAGLLILDPRLASYLDPEAVPPAQPTEAVVLFTADPEHAETHVRQLGLFEEDSIHVQAVFEAG